MKGTEFTLELLGKIAAEHYSLYSFGPSSTNNNGEFLTYGKDDLTRYAVHVHFYTKDMTCEEDKVTIPFHAIWSKSEKDGWWRRKHVLKAECQGKRWVAQLENGETERIEGSQKQNKFNPLPNEEQKELLYRNVVEKLADILQATLNEDLLPSDDSSND